MTPSRSQTPEPTIADTASVVPERATFAQNLEALLEGRLQAAIHFQPIVDLVAGATTGYEALARFPAEFNAGPDVCFAKAEVVGLRLELEKLLSTQALASRKLLPTNCFLTLNVGPAFLVSKEWQEVLRSAGNLAGVVVEVTEEACVENYDEVRTRLAQIRASGGSIAVDDAGAGFASLHHILEMKPDFIKLDRHFTKNCHSDRAKSTMIEMMGAAANRMDAWIIAEGIETLPEMEELIRLGVPLGQGYYLARPHAEMLAVDSALAETIVSRNQNQRSAASVEDHLISARSCSTPEQAVKLLSSFPELRATIVTDEWNRPRGLYQNHPLVGVREIPGFMRTQLSSEPSEVLRRALTRDLASRHDPVVVIGAEGEYLGILAVDRLMYSFLGTDLTSHRQHLN